MVPGFLHVSSGSSVLGGGSLPLRRCLVRRSAAGPASAGVGLRFLLRRSAPRVGLVWLRAAEGLCSLCRRRVALGGRAFLLLLGAVVGHGRGPVVGGRLTLGTGCVWLGFREGRRPLFALFHCFFCCVFLF